MSNADRLSAPPRRQACPLRRSRCVAGSRLLPRDRLRLAQLRKALERFGLNLTHALARHPEPASDLPERLRLAVAESVAEAQHRPLPVLEERERLRQRLRPQRVLD